MEQESLEIIFNNIFNAIWEPKNSQQPSTFKKLKYEILIKEFTNFSHLKKPRVTTEALRQEVNEFILNSMMHDELILEAKKLFKKWTKKAKSYSQNLQQPQEITNQGSQIIRPSDHREFPSSVHNQAQSISQSWRAPSQYHQPMNITIPSSHEASHANITNPTILPVSRDRSSVTPPSVSHSQQRTVKERTGSAPRTNPIEAPFVAPRVLTENYERSGTSTLHQRPTVSPKAAVTSTIISHNTKRNQVTMGSNDPLIEIVSNSPARSDMPNTFTGGDTHPIQQTTIRNIDQGNPTAEASGMPPPLIPSSPSVSASVLKQGDLPLNALDAREARHNYSFNPQEHVSNVEKPISYNAVSMRIHDNVSIGGNTVRSGVKATSVVVATEKDGTVYTSNGTTSFREPMRAGSVVSEGKRPPAIQTSQEMSASLPFQKIHHPTQQSLSNDFVARDYIANVDYLSPIKRQSLVHSNNIAFSIKKLEKETEMLKASEGRVQTPGRVMAEFSLGTFDSTIKNLEESVTQGTRAMNIVGVDKKKCDELNSEIKGKEYVISKLKSALEEMREKEAQLRKVTIQQEDEWKGQVKIARTLRIMLSSMCVYSLAMALKIGKGSRDVNGFIIGKKTDSSLLLTSSIAENAPNTISPLFKSIEKALHEFRQTMAEECVFNCAMKVANKPPYYDREKTLYLEEDIVRMLEVVNVKNPESILEAAELFTEEYSSNTILFAIPQSTDDFKAFYSHCATTTSKGIDLLSSCFAGIASWEESFCSAWQKFEKSLNAELLNIQGQIQKGEKELERHLDITERQKEKNIKLSDTNDELNNTLESIKKKNEEDMHNMLEIIRIVLLKPIRNIIDRWDVEENTRDDIWEAISDDFDESSCRKRARLVCKQIANSMQNILRKYKIPTQTESFLDQRKQSLSTYLQNPISNLDGFITELIGHVCQALIGMAEGNINNIITSFVNELSKLRGELTQKDTLMYSQEQELSKKNHQLSEQMAQNESNEASLVMRERGMREEKEKNEGLSKEIKKLNNEIDKLRTALESSESEHKVCIQSLKDEKLQLYSTINSSSEKLKELTEEKDAVEMKNKEINEELTIISKRNNELEQRCLLLESEKSTSEGKHREELQHQRSLQKDAEATIKKRGDELMQKALEIERLNDQLRNQDESAKSLLQDEIKEFKKILEESNRKVEGLQHENQSLRVVHEEQIEQQKALVNDNDNLQFINTGLSNTIDGLKASIETEKIKQQAVCDAFKAELEKKEQEHLKDVQEIKHSIQKEKYAMEMREKELLEDAKVLRNHLDSLSESFEKEKQNHSNKIEAMEGTLKEKTYESNSLQLRLQSISESYEGLQNSYAKLEKEYTSLKQQELERSMFSQSEREKLEALGIECQDLNKELETYRKESEQKEQAMNKLHKKVEEQSYRINELLNEMKELEQQKADLEYRIDLEMKDKDELHLRKNEELEEWESAKKGYLERLEKQKNEYDDKEYALRDELMQVRKAFEDVESKCKEQEIALSKIQDEKDFITNDYCQRLIVLQKELEAQRNDCETALLQLRENTTKHKLEQEHLKSNHLLEKDELQGKLFKEFEMAKEAIIREKEGNLLIEIEKFNAIVVEKEETQKLLVKEKEVIRNELAAVNDAYKLICEQQKSSLDEKKALENEMREQLEKSEAESKRLIAQLNAERQALERIRYATNLANVEHEKLETLSDEISDLKSKNQCYKTEIQELMKTQKEIFESWKQNEKNRLEFIRNYLYKIDGALSYDYNVRGLLFDTLAAIRGAHLQMESSYEDMLSEWNESEPLLLNIQADVRILDQTRKEDRRTVNSVHELRFVKQRGGDLDSLKPEKRNSLVQELETSLAHYHNFLQELSSPDDFLVALSTFADTHNHLGNEVYQLLFAGIDEHSKRDLKETVQEYKEQVMESLDTLQTILGKCHDQRTRREEDCELLQRQINSLQDRAKDLETENSILNQSITLNNALRTHNHGTLNLVRMEYEKSLAFWKEKLEKISKAHGKIGQLDIYNDMVLSLIGTIERLLNETTEPDHEQYVREIQSIIQLSFENLITLSKQEVALQKGSQKSIIVANEKMKDILMNVFSVETEERRKMLVDKMEELEKESIRSNDNAKHLLEMVHLLVSTVTSQDLLMKQGLEEVVGGQVLKWKDLCVNEYESNQKKVAEHFISSMKKVSKHISMHLATIDGLQVSDVISVGDIEEIRDSSILELYSEAVEERAERRSQLHDNIALVVEDVVSEFDHLSQSLISFCHMILLPTSSVPKIPLPSAPVESSTSSEIDLLQKDLSLSPLHMKDTPAYKRQQLEIESSIKKIIAANHMIIRFILDNVKEEVAVFRNEKILLKMHQLLEEKVKSSNQSIEKKLKNAENELHNTKELQEKQHNDLILLERELLLLKATEVNRMKEEERRVKEWNETSNLQKKKILDMDLIIKNLETDLELQKSKCHNIQNKLNEESRHRLILKGTIEEFQKLSHTGLAMSRNVASPSRAGTIPEGVSFVKSTYTDSPSRENDKETSGRSKISPPKRVEDITENYSPSSRRVKKRDEALSFREEATQEQYPRGEGINAVLPAREALDGSSPGRTSQYVFSGRTHTSINKEEYS